MDEKELQKELFDEFEAAPAKRQPPGGLARSAHVTVPVEKLVFVSIGVLLFFVAVYAVGIERGKAMERVRRVGPEGVRKAGVSPAPAVLPAPGPVIDAPSPAALPARPVAYTVYLGTYQQKAPAVAEALKLKKAGLSTFLRTGPKIYQLCAGRFPTEAEAQRLCSRLKARYKVCVVIKIN